MKKFEKILALMLVFCVLVCYNVSCQFLRRCL